MAQNNPIPSNVSDTDFAVFEQLANLKRVDFSKGALPKRGYSEPILEEPRMDESNAPPPPYQEYPSAPRTTGRGRSPMRISVGQFPDEMPPPAPAAPAPYDFSQAPPPPMPSYVPPPRSSGNRHSSRFAEQVQQQLTQHPRSVPPPPPPNFFAPPPARGPSNSKFNFPPPPPPPPPPAAAFRPQYQPQARPQQLDENELRKMHANYGTSDEDSLRRKKKRLMDEVPELEKKGYVFEVRPTMEDSLEDIQDKVDQGHSTLEMRHTITFARENIPNVYGFLEMANNMWGPFLPIQGFTDQLEEKIRENPARYNYVLERMYRKYWRKGSMSPMMEFFMVFILPFFMYAGKQKFFGGASSAGSKPPPKQANSVAPEPPRANMTVPEPMNVPAPQYSPPPQYHPQMMPQQYQSHYLPPQQPPARLNPFNVGPSVPPQPHVGQIFPPPMMAQPPVVAVPTAVLTPNLNTSSSKKHLKPPSRVMAFPTSQKPLSPQPQQPQPIIIQPVLSPPPPPTHQSLPPPIPKAGPIRVEIPSTPIKSHYEPIPSESKLPPIVEQPEEDESEL